LPAACLIAACLLAALGTAYNRVASATARNCSPVIGADAAFCDPISRH
jgi:hypothetical protein